MNLDWVRWKRKREFRDRFGFGNGRGDVGVFVSLMIFGVHVLYGERERERA